jgi:hypothetical protein
MKNVDDTLAEAPVEAPRKSRKNNPEKTRDGILQAAVAEFVAQACQAPGSTPSPNARKPPSG